MASQQISTAIKEDWNLTVQQVDLINDSTAQHAKQAPPVEMYSIQDSFASVGPDEGVANILVPTPDRLDVASAIVALWEIKGPAEGDVQGSTKLHLSAKTVVEMVNNIVNDLKQKAGFAATVKKMQGKAKDFIMHCLHNTHDNYYAIWDATSITDEVLSIGQVGARPYEPKDLSSTADYYCQLQLALGYWANLKSFTCGYSYVYRQKDELTTAIVDSGSTVRINAIRILYANLLAHNFETKGDNRFKLVASNEPYPDLPERASEK